MQFKLPVIKKIVITDMAMKFVFLFVCWMALLSVSKGSPIEDSTLPPEPVIVQDLHGIHILNKDDLRFPKSEEESDSKEDVNKEGSRSNYSRQLTLTSTLGYDEWWFATTRRPQIYLRDFPGRPGVATWKEISPSAPVDNRKSRKMGPTAAGVSSNSWSLTMSYNFSQNLISSFLVIFCIFRFCWT